MSVRCVVVDCAPKGGRHVFGLILTAGFTVMLAYVCWRVWSVPFLRNRVTGKALILTAAGLWLLFFLGRYVAHDESGWPALVLETVGMVLLASTFLTAMCLLAVDIVTLFGFLFRKWVPYARSAALAAGVVLSAIALVQGLRDPVIVEYEVVLPGLPAALDGTVVVALSDTHLGPMRDESWLAKRVEQVRALKPDMLVMLGDNIEGHGEIPHAHPSLASLSPSLGKWFVYGNHDTAWRGESVTGALEDAGVKLLNDQWVQVAPGLILAGVSDLTTHYRAHLKGDPVPKALSGTDPKQATLLLSHTPWDADKAASLGADLMLSGHTHGGQIWPNSLFVSGIYPLLAGRYEVNGMTAIVSRGTGLWGPPMRLWHPSEILRITLRAPVTSLTP